MDDLYQMSKDELQYLCQTLMERNRQLKEQLDEALTRLNASEDAVRRSTPAMRYAFGLSDPNIKEPGSLE